MSSIGWWRGGSPAGEKRIELGAMGGVFACRRNEEEDPLIPFLLLLLLLFPQVGHGEDVALSLDG